MASKGNRVAQAAKPAKDAQYGPAVLAPKSTEYEFMGPLGAFFISTTVPLFTYLFYAVCNPDQGCAFPPTSSALQSVWSTAYYSFFDGTAWALYGGWYAFMVVCWAILPGAWEQGLPLRTGNRLEYKINAMNTGIATAVVMAAWIAVSGTDSFTIWYDHWPGLVSASLVNSIVQAVFVYAGSFAPNRLLAAGGNSGNVLYDWFIGRELNPRIGSFDFKTFNELRPGLILWCVLDVSCLCAQRASYGKVTDSMWLVVVFHTYYVADALFNEATIFSQMDITTDGFGFMLSVGDLTWVPFTYSLQARYLAFTPLELGWVATGGVLALNALGYYIFRTANLEKNEFRNGKNPKQLQFMPTKRGTKLLTSGWWGVSRHPNYLGDWIMAWAWCLPTGFSTPLTYFYVVYFAILLVHRQQRDDAACRIKYGDDWTVYCRKVPARILPYIY